MKTTLEVPDELYLEVKSQAALRRRKIKDYVAEGLRLALAADRNRELVEEGSLAVFEEVRQSPLHSSAEVTTWIEQTNAERKAHWRDEG
jgi:hypothetical protein